MKVRWWVVLVLAVLVASTPLAYASPPDPSWIRGLYDDGDGDDVVVFLTGGSGAVAPFPLADLHPLAAPAAPVILLEELRVSAATFASAPPRAPPSPR